MLALLLALMVFTAGAALATADSTGGGYPDVRGTYSGGVCIGGSLAACEASPQYPHTKTISTEDFNTGAVSAPGLTGQVTGCVLVTHVSSGSYSSTETETISSDGNTLTGSFSDSNGNSGPDFDVRTSGGPTHCPALRSSATTLKCVAAGSPPFSCTATVSDSSGDSPAAAPTGTVSFSTTAGALAAESCQLAAVSGSAAGCSVGFTPPSPASASPPQITASYAGDTKFSSSQGDETAHEISGTLTNDNCGCGGGPSPESDVNVAVTSSGGGGVLTTGASNDQGVWSVDVPDGNYTVTPDASTYSWNPPSQTVTVNGADADGIDFDTCGKAEETSSLRQGSSSGRVTAQGGHCTVTTVKCTGAQFPLPSDCFVTVQSIVASDGSPKGSVGASADGSVISNGAGAGGCGDLVPTAGGGAKSYCTFSILAKPGAQRVSVTYFPQSSDWHVSEGTGYFTITPPKPGSTKKDISNWLTTESGLQSDIGTVMLDLGTGGGGAAVLFQSQTATLTASAALKLKAAVALEVTAAGAAVGGIQKYGLSPVANLLSGYFKDPPDQKYRAVSKPRPDLSIPKRYRHVFDQRDVTADYHAAAQLRALASAESTAVNRAMTAGKKGASKWRNLQVAAAIKYLRQMADETHAMIADQTRLAHAVARTTIGKFHLRFKSPTLRREFGHVTYAQLFDDPTEIRQLRHLASLYLAGSKDPAPLAFPKLPALFP